VRNYQEVDGNAPEERLWAPSKELHHRARNVTCGVERSLALGRRDHIFKREVLWPEGGCRERDWLWGIWASVGGQYEPNLTSPSDRKPERGKKKNPPENLECTITGIRKCRINPLRISSGPTNPGRILAGSKEALLMEMTQNQLLRSGYTKGGGKAPVSAKRKRRNRKGGRHFRPP